MDTRCKPLGDIEILQVYVNRLGGKPSFGVYVPVRTLLRKQKPIEKAGRKSW